MTCPVCAGDCQCERSERALPSELEGGLPVSLTAENFSGLRLSELTAGNASTRVGICETAAGRDEWKNEVATRLKRYRNRRYRTHGDNDSLALNFEPEAISGDRPSLAASHQYERADGLGIAGKLETEILRPAEALLEKVAVCNGETLSRLSETVKAVEGRGIIGVTTQEGKIIEFPGGHECQGQPELAEPVVTAPRIFEAEEVEQATREQESHTHSMPARAMPTVTLEPGPNPENEPKFELPLPVAPIAVRAFAAAFDIAVAGSALLTFALTLTEMHSLPQGRPMWAMMGLASAGLWCLYQFLFLLRQGTTPGMRVAGLTLIGFDNRPVDGRRLRTRAWSVALSSVALGLGFAWALLDEDRLGWHDRVSRSCTTRN